MTVHNELWNLVSDFLGDFEEIIVNEIDGSEDEIDEKIDQLLLLGDQLQDLVKEIAPE